MGKTGIYRAKYFKLAVDEADLLFEPTSEAIPVTQIYTAL